MLHPSICAALEAAAKGSGRITVFDELGQVVESVTYADLLAKAYRVASALAMFSLGRGERVGLIADTSVAYMSAFLGCQYAGLIPCNLSCPHTLMARSGFAQRLEPLIRASELSLIVVPDELETSVVGLCRMHSLRCATFSILIGEAEVSRSYQPLGAGDPSYVQYSSGTTSAPKGLLISQQAICANVDAITASMLEIVPDDRALSWLPLHHDMGFVGMFLGSLFSGIDADFMRPQAFLRQPLTWLKLMSERRSTITYAPPFALDLCVKHLQRLPEAPKLDISALRILGVGAEMIRPDVIERFHRQASAFGLSVHAYTPSYGMAEATLAVSVARGISESCAQGDSSLRVSCGEPLPGVQIRICAQGMRVCDDGEIGDLYIKSESLFSGYVSGESGEPELTEDGYYATGDLGFISHGCLFITGRAKELVIVNGRKIWLHELEATATEVAGGAHGDAVAVRGGDSASDDVVIFVKQRAAAGRECAAVFESIRLEIRRRHGISCEIRPASARDIRLTSSGKLVRSPRDSGLAGV